MEYVIVEFPENRSVLIDGAQSGATNQTLMVEEGHHEFAIEGNPDFEPASQETLVQNTDAANPLIVVFSKRDDGGTDG